MGVDIDERTSTDSFSMRSPAEGDVLRKASYASAPLYPKSHPRRKFLTKGGSLVAKWLFLILCTLCLLVFMAFVGLAIWLWVTDIGGVFHLTFKAVILVTGIVGMVICLAGIVGVTYESRELVMLFFVVLLLLFLGQLGFFIFLIAKRDALSVLLASTWEKATEIVKGNIQSEFRCCGYTSPSDFPGPNCQPEWTEGCIVKIRESMSTNAVNVITGVCATVFIELCGLLLACFLMFRIPTRKQRIELELEEAWLRTLGDDPEPLDLF